MKIHIVELHCLTMLFFEINSINFSSNGEIEMDYPTDLRYNAEPITAPDYPLRPYDDLVDYVHEYARQKPEVVALACLGIGFILGWKLKPW